MKIYTEINYQWVDGRLVETSSKSFEYSGNLILCGGGGGGGAKGGGGGGGGGTLGAIVDSATDAVTDPISTAESAVASSVETTQDIADNPGGVVSDVVEETGSAITTAGVEGIDAGMDVVSEVATTTATNLAPVMAEGQRAGDALDSSMQVVAAETGRWTDAARENIDSGLGFIGEKAGEISTFIHGSRDPVDEPLKKGAISGSKKGKGKSELGTNKGKKRARKSLRIGQ